MDRPETQDTDKQNKTHHSKTQKMSDTDPHKKTGDKPR